MNPDPDITRPLIRKIAFFGDSQVLENDALYISAYNVAKILAQKGFVIVNGGGPGVMDASTKGASEAGGESISVTFNPQDAPGYEGKYLGNVTNEEIITTNYIDRMFKLLEHADMFIIFKGGTGTISEFGTAWVLAKLYYGHHKPFILYGDFWIEIIDTFRKNMNLSKLELSVFEIVAKEADVLPVIRKFEKRLESVDHSKHCKVCSDLAFMK